MQILNIEPNERILIIAPHPDDECIGAGGVLLKYRKQCSVFILTDGAIGQGKNKKSEEIMVRKNEIVAEMNYLSIADYHFFDIPDGTLLNNTDCLQNLNLSMYDYIFVTSAKDGHPDHTGAFEAVIKAVVNLKEERIPRIFLYEVHKQLVEPTAMLDITSYLMEKKRLIQFHQSQVTVLPYDEMASFNAGYRALQNRMSGRFVEVYQEVSNLWELENDHNSVLERDLQKQIQFYQLLVRWMKKKNEGKNVSSTLIKQGIYNIVIYGYAELGQLLYEELLNTKVAINYILDKNPVNKSNSDVEILFPQKTAEKTNVVIVTAIFYYKEIKKELIRLGYSVIYSLNEIIDWM